MASTKSEQDSGDLEILSVDLIPSEEELEMDADTFSLEEDAPAYRSTELLRSDLRSKDERISSLQYDIAQLRSRWNGLEKEIEAREELTSILQADLKTVHKQLRERDRRIRKLEIELENTDAAATVAIDEQDGIDIGLDAVDDRIEHLTRQASEDAERIRQLEQDLEVARSEKSAKSNRWILWGDLPRKYSDRGQEITTLKRHQERLERELREADSERGRVKAMLKVAQRENTELKGKLREARAEIRDYSANERPANNETIARQEGQIVDLSGRLAQLEARLQQSEDYSDELRRKLAEARSGDVDLSARAAELEEALAESRRSQADLEASLDEATRKIESLEARAGQLAKDHEAELKTLRFELGEAQETIANHDSVNEELAAELLEKTSARDALQRSLEKSEQERDETVRTLTAKLKKADNKLAEIEEQLENKDKSIAALLSELANNSQSIESIDEIEEAIQELNGRISNRIDERTLEDQDRPARALTGSFEGKELRFPLLKDRLTVGRTSRNDIQLHAQFVSRHHAILLVEDGQTRIIDWGSKNGVFVNDERIEESDLHHGDRVAIGNAEFLYEELSTSEAAD